MVQRYIDRWELVLDGDPIATHSSDLLPVLYNGTPAILKIARDTDERAGALLMKWWDGDGAAQVLMQDDEAVLLERALGQRSLSAMARSGHDDEASGIICTVAARLHAPRPQPPPGLTSLREWFGDLAPAAARYGGILVAASKLADHLFNSPQDIGVLHGDLHHDNVLDTGHRGWVAIDPKHLIGERGFDFANIFCNPDQATATSPGRLRRQVKVVAQAAHLDCTRLLQWIVAYAGLSAAWILNDGNDASLPLTIASLAAQELTTA